LFEMKGFGSDEGEVTKMANHLPACNFNVNVFILPSIARCSLMLIEPNGDIINFLPSNEKPDCGYCNDFILLNDLKRGNPAFKPRAFRRK